MKYNTPHQRLALVAASAALLSMGRSSAAPLTLYFDVNGSTAGFGNLHTGGNESSGAQWGFKNGGDNNTDNDWTTDPTGSSATQDIDPILTGAFGNRTATTSDGLGTNAIFDLTGTTTGSPLQIRVSSSNYGAQHYVLAGLSLVNNSSGSTLEFINANQQFGGDTFNFNGGNVQVDAGAIAIDKALNFAGNYTKTGAGDLIFNNGGDKFSSGGSPFIIPYVGTATLSTGRIFLNTTAATGASSNFDIGSGTSLFFNAPKSGSAQGSGSGYAQQLSTGVTQVGALSGTGTIASNNTTNAGGSIKVLNSLAPGEVGTVGLLTVNLTVASAKTLDISGIATGGLNFDLSSPGASDEVVFSGSGGALNIGSGVLGLSSFTFAGSPTAGVYTLFDLNSTNNGILGSLNSGDVNGTVGGFQATLAEVNAGGALQLTLEAAAVPEPSTYAMLIGGLAALGFYTRRRSA